MKTMGTSSSFKIKNMSPQLPVADIGRSVEFYVGNLGFELNFRYDDFYSGIVTEGYSIHLKSGKSSRDKRKNHDDPDIVFSVSGINELYNQLLDKPIEIVQPLREMPYGKEFYVADPDGNVIAFLEA